MRRFTHRRRARLSECDPRGRVRLDALACWLQDVASDDVADAGLTDADGVWIVRRLRLEVPEWPHLRQEVEVTTWASGAGAAVAERRTSIGPGLVEGTALWAAVDPRTQRPMRLTDSFHDVYGPSIAGRKVSGRLQHDDPPPACLVQVFPLRFTDLDRVGHVNNAVYLEAVEELCADGEPPRRVEIEWRGGLAHGTELGLVTLDGQAWFLQESRVAASARWS